MGAELGTMRVTEQIDALEVLATHLDRELDELKRRLQVWTD